MNTITNNNSQVRAWLLTLLAELECAKVAEAEVNQHSRETTITIKWGAEK